MIYEPDGGYIANPVVDGDDYIVAAIDGKPLLKRDGEEHGEARYRYARLADLPPSLAELLSSPGGREEFTVQYCGSLHGVKLVGFNIRNESLLDGLSSDLEARELRQWFHYIPPEFMAGLARVMQILHWDETSRFCPRCGSVTRQSEKERVKRCDTCGYDQYPRITPAVICAVSKGDRLLLARNAKRTNFFSVIAGFVEVGESAEQCVVREVKEEVGIEVQNIRYFDSQAWPFPSTLMLGYTAEWKSGEIAVDGVEIVEADWYREDELPPVPGPMSIARRLIDAFFAAL